MKKITPIPTKNEFVYNEIKANILSGTLKPNQRIVISSLAKRFGVSEIPVRDALNKLFGEGLVDYGANNGVRVSAIQASDFKNILELRIVLESACTKMAVEYITKEQISKLKSLVVAMDTAIQEDNYVKYGKLNRDFHNTLYRSCKNELLKDYINDLFEKSRRAQRVFDIQHHRGKDSNAEHKKILEAIEEGNSEKASLLMKAQKEASLNYFFNQMKQLEGGTDSCE